MSKKIKIEEKISSGMKSEILQVADIVAKDKGIDKEEILVAMEQAILKTAQLKYGSEKNLVAEIDRKSGDIEVFSIMTVVDEVLNPSTEISITDALLSDQKFKIGDEIRTKLPPLDFGRVAAQSARQVIIQKVKTAERSRQQEEFSGRVGDIITGVVKRVEFSDIVMDVGRTEGIIRKSEIIPNETFKIGDRIKVLLVSVNKDPAGPLLQLSRTHPDFLRKLFEQEVPEIYDGVVRVVAVARDPGSKAKIAVTTSDSNLDPIGSCVGVKGSRVQAVVDELRGEKIDIILWDENPAMFIVNSLSPADVSRIVFEETGTSVDAVVPNDQLSTAIGRRGQNVRLASKLTGFSISVITEEDDAKNRARESSRIVKLFMEGLDVDEMVAHLLMGEGYSGVDELAETSIQELSSIEGFDEDVAAEIKNRAAVYLEKKQQEIRELCKENGVKQDLMEYKMISPELLETLVKSGIKSLDDLGALATDELLEVSEDLLNKREAETLIMKIREKWF